MGPKKFGANLQRKPVDWTSAWLGNTQFCHIFESPYFCRRCVLFCGIWGPANLRSRLWSSECGGRKIHLREPRMNVERNGAKNRGEGGWNLVGKSVGKVFQIIGDITFIEPKKNIRNKSDKKQDYENLENFGGETVQNFYYPWMTTEKY